MISIKQLSTSELISEASALLYEIYIEQMQWAFQPDNPSKIRVENINGQNFLVDKFINNVIWFGAFYNFKMIGCARLCGIDNGYLEIEGYQSSSVINQFLPKNKNLCMEITRVAVSKDHLGKGVVNQLLFSAFEHCRQHKYSIIACTYNGYLKSLLKKIKFPLRLEEAFKYESDDPMPVSFYFADYDKGEVNDVVEGLKNLNMRFNKNNMNVLKALEIVAPILPVAVYWQDKSGTVLGLNKRSLHGIGGSEETIIGKTPYEFYPDKIANHILSHNQEVIETGQTLSQEEEIINVSTGKIKYFKSFKSPLYNEEGHIVGIVGTSLEITPEKEIERMKSESQKHLTNYEIQRSVCEEHNKFHEFIGKMMHKLKSPLASMQQLSQTIDALMPHNEIQTLKSAIASITDIVEHMLGKYPLIGDIMKSQRQPVIMSIAILHALSQIRYRYKDLNIQFESIFEHGSDLGFIQIEPEELNRVLLDLINNAVSSIINSSGGKIIITLSSCNSKYYIVSITSGIEDNSHYAVNDNPAYGYDPYIKNIVATNSGTLEIRSRSGCMSDIYLTFPKTDAPEWFTNKINITDDAIIIIVDDEPSIHGTWDLLLHDSYSSMPPEKHFIVRHFKQSSTALEFIHRLSPEEINRVCLLCDYEFKNEVLNGIDLIRRAGIKNATIITSYYTDPNLQIKAIESQARIFPKDLIYAARINLHKNSNNRAIIGNTDFALNNMLPC